MSEVPATTDPAATDTTPSAATEIMDEFNVSGDMDGWDLVNAQNEVSKEMFAITTASKLLSLVWDAKKECVRNMK